MFGRSFTINFAAATTVLLVTCSLPATTSGEQMQGVNITIVGDRRQQDRQVIFGNTKKHMIPSFAQLKAKYPGFAHYGGEVNNHQLIDAIGCNTSMLLHDTSALRLSVTFNKIGGPHSLGKDLIRLSKYGRDSVTGRDELQYIYHPIAYGPYLADKYGYPNVSKLHELDPVDTKKNFWGKQGILRVITYTHKNNMPRGHVALWDCNHFHQARDWIAGHSLITVEFWQSPDSDCSHIADIPPSPPELDVNTILAQLRLDGKPARLRHRHWEKQFIKKYYQLHKSLTSH